MSYTINDSINADNTPEWKTENTSSAPHGFNVRFLLFVFIPNGILTPDPPRSSTDTATQPLGNKRRERGDGPKVATRCDVLVEDSDLRRTIIASIKPSRAQGLVMRRRANHAIEITHLLLIREAVVRTRHGTTLMVIKPLVDDEPALRGLRTAPDRQVNITIQIQDPWMLTRHPPPKEYDAVLWPRQPEFERGQDRAHDHMPALLGQHILPHQKLVGRPANVTYKYQVRHLHVQAGLLIREIRVEQPNAVGLVDLKDPRIVQMKRDIREQLRQ